MDILWVLVVEHYRLKEAVVKMHAHLVNKQEKHQDITENELYFDGQTQERNNLIWLEYFYLTFV